MRNANVQGILRKPSLTAVTRNAIDKFSTDRCSMLAASIGFYSAFSLAPTLFLPSLAGSSERMLQKGGSLTRSRAFSATTPLAPFRQSWSMRTGQMEAASPLQRPSFCL
jgi:uncharacterized protein YgiB involved in biofilm formation